MFPDSGLGPAQHICVILNLPYLLSVLHPFQHQVHLLSQTLGFKKIWIVSLMIIVMTMVINDTGEKGEMKTTLAMMMMMM